MKNVELRISKIRTLWVAIVFLCATVLVTPWMIAGVADEASFQRLREDNDGDRRCLACRMDYRPYQLLNWAAVLVFNGLFGSAAIVGLWRSFGPPTLTIHADGRAHYVLPWSRRRFFVVDGSRVSVTRFGLKFDPALEDQATKKRFDSINVRSFWTNRSPKGLANDLRALNSSWTIVG